MIMTEKALVEALSSSNGSPFPMVKRATNATRPIIGLVFVATNTNDRNG
jgi:hypothetical protein